MFYSQSAVYAAAYAAYQASACNNPTYHQTKAHDFVERVVRAQNLENEGRELILDDIYAEDPVLREEYLHNVCYSALDRECTEVFWRTLGK